MRAIGNDVAHERNTLGRTIEAADQDLSVGSQHTAKMARGDDSLTKNATLLPDQYVREGVVDSPQRRVSNATAPAKQTQIELRVSTVPTIVAG